MDFSAFDRSRLEEYAARAKAAWGDTEAYREYEKRAESLKACDEQASAEGLMDLFCGFGSLRHLPPEDPSVQLQVKKLQKYITDHYYTCTDEILAGLGQIYAAGGEFSENIDAAGGPGTAEFVSRAILAGIGK